jgi:RNA polymerase sigma-70 factor (ECF subfamily)
MVASETVTATDTTATMCRMCANRMSIVIRHAETTDLVDRVDLVDLSDEGLMGLIQSDDVLAFAELYRRHSAEAHSVARYICQGHSRAEDATQDGFVSIWRSRQTYDPSRGGVRGWLLMVVRHRSIDLMRREGPGDMHRASNDVLASLEAPGSVADDTERDEAAAEVRVSLQRLPRFQREVIALSYFGELTQTEIAHRLGVPVGTVKGRMRLGIRKVRAEG